MFLASFFLGMYLFLGCCTFVSPFVGLLLYKWLEDLPPTEVYQFSLISGYLSFVAGALTFALWIVKERKEIPKPPTLLLLMILLWFWFNITSLEALAPADAVWWKWDRTIKVVGFAILTGLMLTTRARIEAFIWVFVLSVSYFALPGALKVIVGGSSNSAIAAGLVVTGADGSFFGDRVEFSVILSVALPFLFYLSKQQTFVSKSWFLKVVFSIAALGCLISLVGTFARTAVLSGSATLVMLALKSRHRLGATLLVVGALGFSVALAPDNWLTRMDTIFHFHGEASAESRLAAWGWAWEVTLAHPILGGGFRVFTLNSADLGRSHWIEAHNSFLEMAAEHGFVGVILFISLLLMSYWTCSRVIEKASHFSDLRWAGDLARAVQVAIVGYAVGASFVSIATSPLIYDIAAISLGVRSIVEASVAKRRISARRSIGTANSVPSPSEVDAL